MTKSSFQPDIEELNYFVVASLVTAAAFTAYTGSLDIRTALFYTGVACLVILTREIGQRTVALLMGADTELNLSVEGSFITILGALIAVLVQLPLLLIFPVTNSFSLKGYEHWGRSVPAMWSKRETQIVSGGIIALLIGWLSAYTYGSVEVARAFSLFTLFQLLPFDYSGIPTGKLDGAYILRSNGFRWLTFFFLTLLTFALTLI